MKTYIVTGGAGFLGKHVLRLLQDRFKVIAVDNLDPICGGDVLVPHYHADVTNFDSIESLVVSCEDVCILHLAAYGRNLSCQHFPLRAWNINVNGTLHVLEIARRHPDLVKRVVCVSSNITLSDQPTVYKETKLAVESLVRLYSSMGVSCMGIRPSNIYGEGQSKTEYQPCAFAGLDKSYSERGYFLITGDGTQARDWTYAGDVARALELTANSGYSGVTVDICTGKLTSMNEIAALLRAPVTYVSARPGDAKVLISDPAPAKEILGFEAAVDLRDGIWDAFPSVRRG